MVGGWNPKSISRFAMSSVRTPVSFLIVAADATNSCLQWRGYGMSYAVARRAFR